MARASSSSSSTACSSTASSELGFTIFGIEASYPDCLRINDYVLHGKGNAVDVAGRHGLLDLGHRGSGRAGRVDARLEQDARAQGEILRLRHAVRPRPRSRMLDYLERVAPELAAASAAPLCPQRRLLRRPLPAAARRPASGACRASRASSRPSRASGSLDRRRRRDRMAAGAPERGRAGAVCPPAAAWPTRAHRIARPRHGGQRRTPCSSRKGPRPRRCCGPTTGTPRESRVPVGRQDADPQHGRLPAGRSAAQQLVVGFAFNQGTFQAIEWGRGLVNHTVAPAPEGSLDHVLAAADIPAFLLDLATAPVAGPVPDWLASRPLSRSIGAVYSAEHARIISKPPTRAAPTTCSRSWKRPRQRVPPRPGGDRTHPSAIWRQRQPTWSLPASATCRRDGTGRGPTVHAHRLALRTSGRPPAGAACASRARLRRGAGARAGWSRYSPPSLAWQAASFPRGGAGRGSKGRGPARSSTSRSGRSHLKGCLG